MVQEALCQTSTSVDVEVGEELSLPGSQSGDDVGSPSVLFLQETLMDPATKANWWLSGGTACISTK